MTVAQYLIAAIFGLSLAAGQILFKIAASQKTIDGQQLGLFSTLFTWPMILALILYGMTVLLYVFLLQQVPLSRAYMFSMGASTIVPILALVIFKEPITSRYLVGAGLVIVGVILSTSN